MTLMTGYVAKHQPRTGSSLQVVEIFGPTIQGEGANVGRAVFFLRLARCNLSCVWCDTAFSWDPERADPFRLPRKMNAAEILAFLDPRINDPMAPTPAVRHVVISGGEPLLQAVQLFDILTALRELGWAAEVETSGSVHPGPLTTLVDRFNVSPKLANSRVAKRARLRLSVLEDLAAQPSSIFKFVVERVEELDEIAEILGQLSLPVSPERVFVMAQGVDAETVLARSRDLVDAVVARGWGLTPRWHTFLWGDEPGH